MSYSSSQRGMVITFYSYKGGTGRSMAVANIGCLLAQRAANSSQRVLVVDWDLGAPGLHRFFSRGTEHAGNMDRPGVIEYFRDLWELLRRKPELYEGIVSAQGWEVLERTLPLDDYLVKNVEPSVPGLDLMKAGRMDAQFAELVNSFDWVSFYEEFGSAIEAFRELLTERYAYCLVDSRTGFTDISGVCTMLLPEKLVGVFTPNRQSLYGLLELVERSVDYRRGSDDLRSLAVFPLPSRIEFAEKELREEWRGEYQRGFEDLFGRIYEVAECDLSGYFDEVQIPHVSYYAYGENIAVLERERRDALSLGRRYEEFCRRLVELDFAWEAQAEAVARARYQVPPAPADFAGREEELRELCAGIERGGVTIWGVRGMGGIGKTALALRVAAEIGERYPDAQLYLDLKGTTAAPLTAAEAMAHVVRSYQPAARLPEGEAELRAAYHSVLHGQRALLLMDNAADRAQVEALMPPPSCVLLVTSRRRFALPGMRALDLETMRPEDARELLLRIAGRIEEYAEEMARLCGYLPLALRLVGSAIAEREDLEPEEYVRGLADEQGRLGLAETSLGLSYELLEEGLRKRWAMLAVFPGTFERSGAGAVWGVEEEEAQEGLSELVRYSLVEWDGEGERYGLHDLARVYAGSRLGEEERREAGRRHAEHYVGVARAANELYKQGGEGVLTGLGLFDLEWGNVQAGQAWAAAHAGEDRRMLELCSEYPDAGAYLLNLRQRAEERIGWLEMAVKAAGELGHKGAQGTHLGNLGLAYSALGEVGRAIEYYEAALAIAREIGNRRGEGNHMGYLGLAYRALGEVGRAIGYNEQALAIAREIGDRRNEGNSLGALGAAYGDLGEVGRAIEYHEEALAIAREIGDRRNEGNWLGNLGVAYSGLGEVGRAIEQYEAALAIAREIGDRRMEGSVLGNLGLAYSALGEVGRAVEYYEQALAIAREIGDRRNEGVWLGNLGLAYSDLGEAGRAIEHCAQALAIAREIGDRRGEGTDLGALGLAYRALGEVGRAIEQYEAALAIAREIGDRRMEGNNLGNLGSVYRALGEVGRAIEDYEAALAIAREIGDRRNEGIWLGALGLAYSALGEVGRARELWEQALEIYEAIRDPNAERVRGWLEQPAWFLRIVGWVSGARRWVVRRGRRGGKVRE